MKETFDALGVELPLMISGTVTDLRAAISPAEAPEAFWYSLRHLRPFSIGMNCAFGAEQLRPPIAQIAKTADAYISVYANAGLPNAMGDYDETPELMGCSR